MIRIIKLKLHDKQMHQHYADSAIMIITITTIILQKRLYAKDSALARGHGFCSDDLIQIPDKESSVFCLLKIFIRAIEIFKFHTTI